MSMTLDHVKYPNSYFRMVQRLSEYEKEAKARLDAQVYVYKPTEYSQYQLMKLIPRKEIV